MKWKIRQVDVTHGPLLPSILMYAFPVMLGSLIQVLFNSADIMVLGHMADSTAVAAVGAAGPIVGLVVSSFVGLSGGTNILLVRYLGAKDEEDAQKTVGTSMAASFLIGIFLAAVGILFARPFLELTDCPAECIDATELYLRLYFAGIPAIMVYNFGAAIIRVSGDTQRPLYYLVAAGILNVGMNVFLCWVLAEKVAAVAVATLASQVLGAVLVTLRLFRVTGACHFDLRRICFSWPAFIKMMRYGLPCAFNSALYSISNLQIQAAINAYGTAAVAGNTASASIEGLVGSFTGAFATAALAFIGQNVGAGDRKRVHRAILQCTVLSFGIGELLSVGFFLLGRQMAGLYIPGETEAIEYAMVRMRYLLLFYGIAALKGIFGSAMHAFGYSLIPMLDSVVCVLVFRVVWMSFIYPLPPMHNIEGLYVCYTISWTLVLLVDFTAFAFIYRNYRRGKLRSI